MLGILRTVLFAPEDLALVKGDPDGRRRFLDELAVQVSPRMAGVLADHERVLRQRGALLKSAAAARKGRAEPDLRTLDVWDSRVAELGAQVLTMRLALVRALAPHVRAAYAKVSDAPGEAVLGYRSSVADEPGAGAGPVGVPHEGASTAELTTLLLEGMARMRHKEIERGVTLVGPHRDDLVLELGGLPAKGYASHGESWSFALALRLASFALLTDGAGAVSDVPALAGWEEGSEPVLILDDVFAELDSRRRARLADLVAGAEQVIVTAAVPEDVPEQLQGARLEVMDGLIGER